MHIPQNVDSAARTLLTSNYKLASSSPCALSLAPVILLHCPCTIYESASKHIHTRIISEIDVHVEGVDHSHIYTCTRCRSMRGNAGVITGRTL